MRLKIIKLFAQGLGTPARLSPFRQLQDSSRAWRHGSVPEGINWSGSCLEA